MSFYKSRQSSLLRSIIEERQDMITTLSSNKTAPRDLDDQAYSYKSAYFDLLSAKQSLHRSRTPVSEKGFGLETELDWGEAFITYYFDHYKSRLITYPELRARVLKLETADNREYSPQAFKRKTAFEQQLAYTPTRSRYRDHEYSSNNSFSNYGYNRSNYSNFREHNLSPSLGSSSYLERGSMKERLVKRKLDELRWLRSNQSKEGHLATENGVLADQVGRRIQAKRVLELEIRDLEKEKEDLEKSVMHESYLKDKRRPIVVKNYEKPEEYVSEKNFKQGYGGYFENKQFFTRDDFRRMGRNQNRDDLDDLFDEDKRKRVSFDDDKWRRGYGITEKLGRFKEKYRYGKERDERDQRNYQRDQRNFQSGPGVVNMGGYSKRIMKRF